jgi:hypothetical protein
LKASGRFSSTAIRRSYSSFLEELCRRRLTKLKKRLALDERQVRFYLNEVPTKGRISNFGRVDPVLDSQAVRDL